MAAGYFLRNKQRRRELGFDFSPNMGRERSIRALRVLEPPFLWYIDFGNRNTFTAAMRFLPIGRANPSTVCILS